MSMYRLTLAMPKYLYISFYAKDDEDLKDNISAALWENQGSKVHKVHRLEKRKEE